MQTLQASQTLCVEKEVPHKDWLLATAIINAEMVPLYGRLTSCDQVCTGSEAPRAEFGLSPCTIERLKDLHRAVCPGPGPGCTICPTIDHKLNTFIFQTWTPAIDVEDGELMLGEPEFATTSILATINMVRSSEPPTPLWKRRQLRRERYARWKICPTGLLL